MVNLDPDNMEISPLGLYSPRKCWLTYHCEDIFCDYGKTAFERVIYNSTHLAYLIHTHDSNIVSMVHSAELYGLTMRFDIITSSTCEDDCIDKFDIMNKLSWVYWIAVVPKGTYCMW
jgi:hypothetical protein